MPDFLSISPVIRLTALVAGLGMTISTLEYIANIRQCRSEGLFSWDVWRENKFSNWPTLKRVTHPLFGFHGVLAVLLARVTLFALFLYSLSQSPDLDPVLLTGLFATQLYVNFRFPVGKDGSDQMSSIVLAMLFLIAWFPDRKVIANACIVFIAYQSIVSYITAGVAKLISPQWRSGDIILGVLSTETYGSRSVAFVLRDHAWIRRTLNHGTVAFESLMFLAILLPYPYNAYFLVVPLAFHAACAVLMGLNGFLFAFAATFPSVLYVSNHLHRIPSLLEQCT